MASQTQTRVVVRETRTLDHLYDPVMTTSGAVNHNRLTAKAMATELQKVPEEMFSELVHYPRASWKPVEKGAIPTNVDTRWQPNLDRDPDNSVIYGTHRYKYIQRPVAHSGTFSGSAPQIVMYEVRGAGAKGRAQQQQQMGGAAPSNYRAEGPTKTVGTQSTYRESEAQTVPLRCSL
jgi:hypothetical protein